MATAQPLCTVKPLSFHCDCQALSSTHWFSLEILLLSALQLLLFPHPIQTGFSLRLTLVASHTPLLWDILGSLSNVPVWSPPPNLLNLNIPCPGYKILSGKKGGAVPACIAPLLLQVVVTRLNYDSDTLLMSLLISLPCPPAGAHNRESHVFPSGGSPLTPKPLPARAAFQGGNKT